MEWNVAPDQAAALAGAVAVELNDHLTVILNSLFIEAPGPEEVAAVERATLRCARVAKGLSLYSQRYGNLRRPLPLGAVFDEDML